MKSVIAGLLATILMVAPVAQASDVPVTPLSEMYSSSNVILVGEAVSFELAPERNEAANADIYYVNLKVDNVIKGENVPTTVKVRAVAPLVDPEGTNYTDMTYGHSYYFVKGETYLVAGVVASYEGHPTHIQPVHEGFGIILQKQGTPHYYAGPPYQPLSPSQDAMKGCFPGGECLSWAEFVTYVRDADSCFNEHYRAPIGGEL